jgi:spore maturation protein CgeB
MLLRNNIITLKLMSSNIRLITLINYIIELIAPYNSIVFYKSLNSVKNTIKSLLLRYKLIRLII